MKKLLLLVVILVVVAGLGLAVVSHYQTQKHQEQAKAVPTISVAESNRAVGAVTKAADEKYTSLVTKFNAQVTECQKGKVAYDKLATLTKVLPATPVCATPIQP
jgi:uncharacterized protein HemX